MNSLVQRLCVHQPVAIVKQDGLEKHKDDQVDENLRDRGQRTIHLDPACDKAVVGRDCERHVDADLVEEAVPLSTRKTKLYTYIRANRDGSLEVSSVTPCWTLYLVRSGGWKTSTMRYKSPRHQKQTIETNVSPPK